MRRAPIRAPSTTNFRSREALAEAVLDRILAPLNEHRLALLTAAEAEAGQAADRGEAIALEVLVESLIRPDIEAACGLEARSSGRARLIGAIYIRPAAFVQARVEAHFRPVAGRFLPHLCAAAPRVSPETLSWRVRWCVFGALGALLSDEDAPFERPSDELAAELVAVLAAALSAR